MGESDASPDSKVRGRGAGLREDAAAAGARPRRGRGGAGGDRGVQGGDGRQRGQDRARGADRRGVRRTPRAVAAHRIESRAREGEAGGVTGDRRRRRGARGQRRGGARQGDPRPRARQDVRGGVPGRERGRGEGADRAEVQALNRREARGERRLAQARSRGGEAQARGCCRGGGAPGAVPGEGDRG